MNSSTCFRNLNQPRVIRRLKQFDLLQFVHPKIVWNAKTLDLFQSIDEILTWHRLEISHEAVQKWLPYAMALFQPIGGEETVKAWKKLGFPDRHIHMVNGFFKELTPLTRSLLRKLLSGAENLQTATWLANRIYFIHHGKSSTKGIQKNCSSSNQRIHHLSPPYKVLRNRPRFADFRPSEGSSLSSSLRGFTQRSPEWHYPTTEMKNFAWPKPWWNRCHLPLLKS